jgi:hypothetical protein
MLIERPRWVEQLEIRQVYNHRSRAGRLIVVGLSTSGKYRPISRKGKVFDSYVPGGSVLFAGESREAKSSKNHSSRRTFDHREERQLDVMMSNIRLGAGFLCRWVSNSSAASVRCIRFTPPVVKLFSLTWYCNRSKTKSVLSFDRSGAESKEQGRGACRRAVLRSNRAHVPYVWVRRRCDRSGRKLAGGSPCLTIVSRRTGGLMYPRLQCHIRARASLSLYFHVRV